MLTADSRMHKKLFLLGIIFCVAGCAALKPVTSVSKQSTNQDSLGVYRSEQGGVAQGALQARKESPQKKHGKIPDVVSGIIFGKTEFSGLLKTSYVRLLIIERGDSSKKYIFSVGDRSETSVLPWMKDSKVIEPGHFVLELPSGQYKMVQMAIPAGSTLAEEGMELDFNVVSGTAVYVGTLKVDGTKEKVKFGGVPLMRPGFEYVLAVKDDFEEAVKAVGRFIPHEFKYKKDLFSVVALEKDGLPNVGVFKMREK